MSFLGTAFRGSLTELGQRSGSEIINRELRKKGEDERDFSHFDRNSFDTNSGLTSRSISEHEWWHLKVAFSGKNKIGYNTGTFFKFLDRETLAFTVL